MTQATVLIVLSNRDFDPSEVAIPWHILKQNGFTVEFATQSGKPGSADPLMLSGEGLDPWGFIPLLKKFKLVGLALRADTQARKAYRALLEDEHFKRPKSFDQLRVFDYAGLVLPGGHAPGMRQYLEDETLKRFVAAFFDATDDNGDHKPVAAVCHGVVLAARAISSKTGHSVLHGKKTTALTWKLEKTAWMLTRWFARFWQPNYYRTYLEQAGEPSGYRSVEFEVKRALAKDSDFLDVDPHCTHALKKSSGLFRDTADNDSAAWVVEDGNYLSARWPGDVHTLAKRLVKKLRQ